jgi:hypothetical protein
MQRGQSLIVWAIDRYLAGRRRLMTEPDPT